MKISGGNSDGGQLPRLISTKVTESGDSLALMKTKDYRQAAVSAGFPGSEGASEMIGHGLRCYWVPQGQPHHTLSQHSYIRRLVWELNLLPPPTTCANPGQD